jgi:hypothetical protein
VALVAEMMTQSTREGARLIKTRRAFWPPDIEFVPCSLGDVSVCTVNSTSNLPPNPTEVELESVLRLHSTLDISRQSTADSRQQAFSWARYLGLQLLLRLDPPLPSICHYCRRVTASKRSERAEVAATHDVGRQATVARSQALRSQNHSKDQAKLCTDAMFLCPEWVDQIVVISPSCSAVQNVTVDWRIRNVRLV